MMRGTPGTNRPEWDAETTNPDLAKKLKQGLQEVVDPELALNVIQLGLIRNLKIEDGAAIVSMILTTPFCPHGPSMIESIRKKAEESLEIPVGIDLGLESWDFSMMEEGLASDWGLY